MVTAELVRRCGELKGELVAFTQASLRPPHRVDDVSRIDPLRLQRRLPTGTMIDLFIIARPISAEQRRIVLGWRDVVKPSSRYAVTRTTRLVGVIDELPYRIHSTSPCGSVGRLITDGPVAADWLFSGEPVLPAARGARCSTAAPAGDRVQPCCSATRMYSPKRGNSRPPTDVASWTTRRSDMAVLPGRQT
jgi:hypothetical protein